MKKSKSSTSGDRFSRLPDSLIFHILWLLPLKDAVRTTILSKHWKNLWTTMPSLNLENGEQNEDVDAFRDFVNRALIFWRGIKIQKFKIELFCALKQPFAADIDMWVRFAKDNGVEELYLHQFDCYEQYLVPQYLFSSCSSVKVLSLIGCSLQVHGNVQWNQLKSLTIENEDLCDNVINQVLSGCPQLEVFFLHLSEENQDTSIRSTSLKKLSIDRNMDFLNGDDHWEIAKDTELKIWTPNLETLEISGLPYRKCLLDNVSSLTQATLNFHPDPDTFSPENDYFDESLRQIFPTIQHVENVTLSNWCIKVAMKNKCLLSRLGNVKFLKLHVFSPSAYELIPSFLESFPKLEMLVLKSTTDIYLPYNTAGMSGTNIFPTNLPNSFLQQLRTVRVTWVEGDYFMFPVIEILLKYASKLERMVLRVRGTAPSKSLLFASQKLLRMQRSSPTAELIFCE